MLRIPRSRKSERKPERWKVEVTSQFQLEGKNIYWVRNTLCMFFTTDYLLVFADLNLWHPLDIAILTFSFSLNWLWGIQVVPWLGHTLWIIQRSVAMCEFKFKREAVWDFPGSPVVKISSSNAGDAGWITGQGAKILQALGGKSWKVKQKQCCNKFNK